MLRKIIHNLKVKKQFKKQAKQYTKILFGNQKYGNVSSFFQNYPTSKNGANAKNATQYKI